MIEDCHDQDGFFVPDCLEGFEPPRMVRPEGERAKLYPVLDHFAEAGTRGGTDLGDVLTVERYLALTAKLEHDRGCVEAALSVTDDEAKRGRLTRAFAHRVHLVGEEIRAALSDWSTVCERAH